MGTVMLTVPPAPTAGATHKPTTLTFSPVAPDIEESDRIFDRTLAQ